MTASSYELYEFILVSSAYPVCIRIVIMLEWLLVDTMSIIMYVVVAAGWRAIMSSLTSYELTVNHCSYPHLGKEKTNPI